MSFAPAHKISFPITIRGLIISEMTLLHILKEGDSFIFPSPGQEDKEVIQIRPDIRFVAKCLTAI